MGFLWTNVLLYAIVRLNGYTYKVGHLFFGLVASLIPAINLFVLFVLSIVFVLTLFTTGPVITFLNKPLKFHDPRKQKIYETDQELKRERYR
jgi:hypothetical protein